MCPTQEAENASLGKVVDSSLLSFINTLLLICFFHTLAMYCFKLAVSMSPQNYRARMCGIRCLADESSDIGMCVSSICLNDCSHFIHVDNINFRLHELLMSHCCECILTTAVFRSRRERT